MRKNGIQDAYEQMKKLTRGEAVTKNSLKKFVEALSMPKVEKEQLLTILGVN